MIELLSGALRHLRVRLKAVLTAPSSLLYLVAAAGLSASLWPGTSGPDGNGWRAIPAGGQELPPAIDLQLVVLWLLLWPILPVIGVAGRSTGSSRGDSIAQRALPALPVTPRSRMVVEATIVLGAVSLGPLARLLLSGPGLHVSSLLDVAVGALVALPVVLAWATPSRSVPLLWLRPALIVAALVAAMAAGLLGHPASVALVSAFLCAAILVSVDREHSLPAWLRQHDAGAPQFRVAAPTDVQVLRDFWREPWRRLGWLIGALVVVQVLALLADRFLGLPGWAFLAVSLLVHSQLFALALKPAGSALLGWGLTGRSGARLEDFGRFFATLPVRPEVVRRAAYLHGLLVSAAVVAGAATTIAARAWLRTGSPALSSPDGHSLVRPLLVGLCVVPLVAGLLASAAAGHRLLTAVSGGALLALFNVPGMLYILAIELLGRGSPAPAVLAIGTIALLTLVGSLPPLALLRPHRAAPGP